MSVKTYPQLQTSAATIKNEMVPGANSAQRLGAFLQDLVDSRRVYRVNLNEGANAVVFDDALDSADFEIFRNCFDEAGNVDVVISDKTYNGFTATAASASTMLYQIIKF
jgi:hypothetical protein